jgi:RNA polymerase sigma factor (sigma-70 family)
VKNFPALLARLATSRAIDMLRARFRLESNKAINDYNSSALNNNPDPAKYAQKQELATQLQKALIKLPVPEAQVFCLRYLNDMSYRRIAKELDIKTNAVGVLLYRAKDKLKKSLSDLQNQQKSEVML